MVQAFQKILRDKIQRGVENVKEASNAFITNTNNKIVCYKLNIEQIQSTFKEKRMAKKKKTFNYEIEEDIQFLKKNSQKKYLIQYWTQWLTA